MIRISRLRSVVASALALGVLVGSVINTGAAYAELDPNETIVYTGNAAGSWQQPVTVSALDYYFSSDPEAPGNQPQTGGSLKFSLVRGTRQVQVLCTAAHSGANGEYTCTSQITVAPGFYDIQVEDDLQDGSPVAVTDAPFTVNPGPLFTSSPAAGLHSSDSLPACHGVGLARHCPILSQ